MMIPSGDGTFELRNNNRQARVRAPRLPRDRSRLPIVVPDQDPRMKTSWFQPSDETMRETESILASTFFVIRQGAEFGERLRCTRCNNRHNYITLMCIEKPVSGLANGLFAYYSALKEAGALPHLTPEQRARVQQIYDALRMMPDLSKTHPQFARKLVQDVGPRDMVMGAIALGVLEGISPTRAQRLADKINEQGIKPKFTLLQPNQAEVDRALEYRGLSRSALRSRW